MNAAKERSVSFLRRPSMGGTREAGSKLSTPVQVPVQVYRDFVCKPAGMLDVNSRKV